MNNIIANKKYSVEDAIWIATALLSYEVYRNNPNSTLEDYYFKQSDIKHNAQMLSDKNVEQARVNWWSNADSTGKHTRNFLRSNLSGDGKLRRLSKLDEFGEKTCPEHLDMSDMFKINGTKITMQELYDFVSKQYPLIIGETCLNHQEFWNLFNEHFYDNLDFVSVFGKPRAAWGKNYYDLTFGGDKVHVVLRHLLKTKTLVTELYFEENKKLYESLKTREKEIQKNFEETVFFKSAGGKEESIARKIYIEKPFDIYADKDALVDYIMWLQHSAIKMKNIIDDHGSFQSSTLGDNWWPSQEQYPVEISKAEWKKFIEEVELKHTGCLRVIKCFIEEGGTASSKQLSEKYKGHPTIYSSSVYNTCRRALSYFEKEPCPDGDNQRYFPIAFRGKQGGDDSSSNYLYRMRAELIEALKEIDLSDIELKYKGEGEKMDTNFDKNLILYGPPGTGKTYNTAIYAVAICDNKSLNEVSEMGYSKVLDRYNELKLEGRIAFTTFHQSYGYEEFIEGIKPVIDEQENSESSSLEYTLKRGLFKSFCEKATITKDYGIGKNPTIWKVSLYKTGDNEIRRECFENDHIRIGYHYNSIQDIEEAIEDGSETRSAVKGFVNGMKQGDIVFSCYSHKTIDAIGVVTGDCEIDESYNEYKILRKVKWIIKGIDEDIFEANNNKVMSLKSVYKLNIPVSYVAELLEKHSDKKQTLNDVNHDNYVFIIDEINRGNISKIFGELITLIEPTKRIGASEAMTVTLPYSEEKFGVPNNVYILGTMNTADRSIAIMDTALRRRFSFVEMMPDADVLREIGADKVEDLDVARMLEVINERITYLYDREHTIGHAFFTKLANSPTIETLQSIFEKSVIPLLQEYFYEDYQKIQFVLGDNAKDDSLKFILDEKSKSGSAFKGDTEDIDIPEKKYSINKVAFTNLESYKTII